MATRLSEEELARLEAAVEGALEAGAAGDLEILGYGEISSVVAWTTEEGDRVAAKRLPPFPTEEHLVAYSECVGAYLEALEAAGVHPVPTAVQSLALADGSLVAYCIQPALPPSSLVTGRLASAEDEAEAVALLEAVVERVEAGVSERLGIDSQISNWVANDGTLAYLDVSTPLIRDEAGQERLDTELFLASLPWALRGLVRWRFLHQILDKYYEPRGAVVDLLGNLVKEGARHLVPPLIERVNLRPFARPAISMDEVDRYYRSDAGMWELLQRLRRLDRAWQRGVRQRTYPFLLPGRIERNV